LTFDEFRPVTYQKWLETAKKQLKGENPEVKLSWDSLFGASLKPYYDAEDHRALGYLKGFYDKLPAFSWIQYESIYVNNVKEANKQALVALQSGSNGVLFKLNQPDTDLNTLTDKILFEHCYVSFLVENGDTDKVTSFAEKNNITGFVMDMVGSRGFYHSSYNTDPVAGTADMLLDFVSRPASNPVIYLQPGQDFFHEMARTRGIRYLISRVADVMEINLKPEDIHIHGEPQFFDQKDENWFTQVTSGLACLFGSANSLSFQPTPGFPRTSRNIGNLIRYESNVDAFRDVAQGSYFIDFLTDLFIKNVWEKFQSKA